MSEDDPTIVMILSDEPGLGTSMDMSQPDWLLEEDTNLMVCRQLAYI